MRARLLKGLRLLLSFIPQALPMDDKAFEAWSADIIALTGFPDNDSVRFALATMVLHLDARYAKVSKRNFIVQLHRASANQAAGNVMQSLKEKQKAANERRLQETPGQMVQKT